MDNKILIEQCNEEISHLERCCDRYYAIGGANILEECQRKLAIQRIALAALEAEPEIVVDYATASSVTGEFVYSVRAKARLPVGTKLYTTPPAASRVSDVSDESLIAWGERHFMRVKLEQLRCAYDDAISLAAAPSKEDTK